MSEKHARAETRMANSLFAGLRSMGPPFGNEKNGKRNRQDFPTTHERTVACDGDGNRTPPRSDQRTRGGNRSPFLRRNFFSGRSGGYVTANPERLSRIFVRSGWRPLSGEPPGRSGASKKENGRGRMAAPVTVDETRLTGAGC